MTDAHKVNIFPFTLEIIALRWFMGLRKDIICTWDQMTKKFLDKYQYYYKDKSRREEVFKMMQSEDESMKDYVEWITYNLERENKGDLVPEKRCVVFLRGI
jgi:hypothetical protein